MSTKYLFQDRCIGIFEHNIDIIRNGYVFKKIEYPDIKHVIITKRYIRNWFLLFILGIFFIISALAIIIFVYNNSFSNNLLNNLLTFWSGSKGFGLHAILFLFAFGAYSVVISIRKTMTLVIETIENRLKFDIQHIAKNQELDGLVNFIREMGIEVTIESN